MSDRVPLQGLEAQGISARADIHWNLETPALVEQAIARGEGKLAVDGPLVVTGAQYANGPPVPPWMKHS